MKDIANNDELKALIKEVLSYSDFNTYDDFIKGVEEILDDAIENLESMANFYHESNENQLTGVIYTYILASKSFQKVQLDSNNRGHCDLLIEKKPFKWLGESKIYSSYPYLYKGTRQLLLRYMNGKFNERKASLLIFFRDGQIKTKMANWDNFLKAVSKKPKHQQRIKFLGSTDINPYLRFISTHQHEITEHNVEINHIPIILHFNPADTIKD